MAIHDSTLSAPKCSVIGASCTSGQLLDGKANNIEPNPLNSLDSCTDGLSNGGYHGDESIDKTTISAVEGVNFKREVWLKSKQPFGHGMMAVKIQPTFTTPPMPMLQLGYSLD